MRERHVNHRKEIKANQCGLGSHFSKHAEEMGIDMDINMEQIMQHFKLIIIRSANDKLKDMEASLMQTLKTTQDYGGMNIMLERKHNQKQYKCEQCDFRANGRDHIWQHKRRDHSDYKLLCDQCGYTTNQSSNFHKHFRRKHSEYLM